MCLLALTGGAVGVLFAVWGKNALAAMGSSPGSLLPADLDYWSTGACSVLLSLSRLFTGVLFGPGTGVAEQPDKT